MIFFVIEVITSKRARILVLQNLCQLNSFLNLPGQKVKTHPFFNTIKNIDYRVVQVQLSI